MKQNPLDKVEQRSHTNVRLWLKADLQSPEIDVCFAPSSGHSEPHAGLPLVTQLGNSASRNPIIPIDFKSLESAFLLIWFAKALIRSGLFPARNQLAFPWAAFAMRATSHASIVDVRHVLHTRRLK
jgi:hypothetical protein